MKHCAMCLVQSNTPTGCMESDAYAEMMNMKNIYAIVLVLISLFSMAVYGQETTEQTTQEEDTEIMPTGDTTTETDVDETYVTEESDAPEQTDTSTETDVDETSVTEESDASEQTDTSTDATFDNTTPEETETEQPVDDVTAEETDVESFEEELEDVAEEEQAVEEAVAETEYTKAYYFLTEKILTAEAVIGFLQENMPAIDVTPIMEYKTKLEELRAGLTENSDFDAVKEQAVALIADARKTTKEIFQENDIQTSDVVDAVQEYKDEETEDDEAKEQWANAREGYVHAKTTVVLARFNNFEKIANRYGDAEQAEELQSLMEQLQAITNQIANAAGTFDKEQIDAAVDQAKTIVEQAKEIAKEMKKSYQKQHKEQREAGKDEKKESNSVGRYGSAQAVDAEDEDDELDDIANEENENEETEDGENSEHTENEDSVKGESKGEDNRRKNKE